MDIKKTDLLNINDKINKTKLEENEKYELLYYMRCIYDKNKDAFRDILLQNTEFTKVLAKLLFQFGVPLNDTIEENTNNEEIKKDFDVEQKILVGQVENLAPEYIESLPYRQRKDIMELREASGLPPI